MGYSIFLTIQGDGGGRTFLELIFFVSSPFTFLLTFLLIPLKNDVMFFFFFLILDNLTGNFNLDSEGTLQNQKLVPPREVRLPSLHG